MSINNKRTSVGRDEFLAAIPGSHGQLAPIEQALNCTRGALRDAISKFPEIKTELDDELERDKDKIIIAMIADSMNGDERAKGKARETLLKAIARDRGFGERLEVTGAEGKPLVFLHTAAKLQSVDGWAEKAAAFAEKRENAINVHIRELGLADEQNAVEQ